MTIKDASSLPLSQQTGNLPNVGSALLNWFQPMTFKILTKTVENFRDVETALVVVFQGVMQPLSDEDLRIKPSGERSWIWQNLHSDTSLEMETDDVVEYQGIQYRVKTKGNYAMYGYYNYHLVEDFEGSGP